MPNRSSHRLNHNLALEFHVLLTKIIIQQSPPFQFMRGRFRQCWGIVLERCRARLAGDVVSELRAWKLFCLVLVMLLHRPRGSGSVGRDELAQRVADFEGGRWIQLLDAASAFTPARPRQTTLTAEEEQKRRGLVVQSRIQRGQVSRARQELTGAALTPNVLKCGCDQSHPQCWSSSPTHLSRWIGRFSILAYKSGGCTNEMLRTCLDDAETLSLLLQAAEDFARGHVPDDVCRALMLATMTGLQKREV